MAAGETKVFHRSLFLQGPVGRLEALLWTPLRPDPPLAKVVFQVAKTLHRSGLAVLRFNFRGAGLSEGVHDEGRGESDDVRAALEFLTGQFPGRPLLLAGFSFGARVGLREGCTNQGPASHVVELIGLGLPANYPGLSFLRTCGKPKLLVQGERDQFGAREKVEALVAGMSELHQKQTTLVFVPGAEHFFTGKLTAVDQVVRAWLVERHPELAPTG